MLKIFSNIPKNLFCQNISFINFTLYSRLKSKSTCHFTLKKCPCYGPPQLPPPPPATCKSHFKEPPASPTRELVVLSNTRYVQRFFPPEFIRGAPSLKRSQEKGIFFSLQKYFCISVPRSKSERADGQRWMVRPAPVVS